MLTAIAGETAAELPEAVRKQKLKQPEQRVGASEEVCAIHFLNFFVIILFPDTVTLIVEYIIICRKRL